MKCMRLWARPAPCTSVSPDAHLRPHTPAPGNTRVTCERKEGPVTREKLTDWLTN